MQKGKSLVELAMELDRRSKSSEDYVVDTRNMHLTPDTSELMIDGVTDQSNWHDPMPINEWAHGQIAYRTDIPKKYYERMRNQSPELLANNVNHWFSENPKRRMVRTLDGDARAFLSDRYRRIDNFPVANVALEAMQAHKDAQFEVLSCDVTDTNLYIQARLPKLEGEVKLNDPVQAGIIVRNSEVGKGKMVVDPLIYRLGCLNGMIVPMSVTSARMRKTHLGSKVLSNDEHIAYQDDTLKAMDEALMKQIRDAILQLSDPALFMKLIDQMKSSTEGPQVQQPVQAVEKLAKTFALPKTEQDSILESLIRNRDYSRWGVLNAVTEQANHDNHAYDRAIELETLGGEILGMNMSAWKNIAEAA